MSEAIAYVRRLRTVADFLASIEHVLNEYSYTEARKANPDTSYDEVSYVNFYHTPLGTEVTLDCHGPESRDLMVTLRKAIGGEWRKDVRDSEYSPAFLLRRDIPVTGRTNDYDHITICIESPRDSVCKPKVIGTKTVTIPAVEARPEQVKEVEVIEWDCGNLLDDSGAAPEREFVAMTPGMPDAEAHGVITEGDAFDQGFGDDSND